jgi:hypothetical protein
MNPSQLLRKFLSTGTKPASVRDQSALLDEARSHLVSKLPTTDETIQNFSDADIDKIVAGGKPGAMDRAYAIYNEKQGRFVKTGNPLAARPAPAARPARKPAPAPVATVKPAVIHRATATAKPTATAAPPRARLKESTDILMRAATMRGISETDRMAARAELEARGFTELPKGGGFAKSFR